MSINNSKLVESIAEGMWYLICDTDNSKNWEWCCENEPGTAAELRFRARCAIIRSTITSSLEGQPTQAKLDLTFKRAFIGVDSSKE